MARKQKKRLKEQNPIAKSMFATGGRHQVHKSERKQLPRKAKHRGSDDMELNPC